MTLSWTIAYVLARRLASVASWYRKRGRCGRRGVSPSGFWICMTVLVSGSGVTAITELCNLTSVHICWQTIVRWGERGKSGGRALCVPGFWTRQVRDGGLNSNAAAQRASLGLCAIVGGRRVGFSIRVLDVAGARRPLAWQNNGQRCDSRDSGACRGVDV
jgi:hypothetical protein